MQYPIGCVRISFNCGANLDVMDCHLKVDPNITTATVYGLVEDKTYTFKLYTLSNDGVISESTDPITVVGYVKPSRPRNFHGKGIDLGAHIQWTRPLQGLN